jgi:hypothetical protein
MRAWDIVCMIIGIFIIIDSGLNKPVNVIMGSLMVMIPLYFNYWSK